LQVTFFFTEEIKFTSIDPLFPQCMKDSDKIKLYFHHSSFDVVTLIFLDFCSPIEFICYYGPL